MQGRTAVLPVGFRGLSGGASRVSFGGVLQ